LPRLLKWITVLLLLGAKPWEQPRVPTLQPIPGVGGLSAQDCGACHQEIYREWKASSHAAAWRDPQFQGELYKDPDVGWLCLNCHTPVANQQERTVIESGQLRAPQSDPNPAFDAALQQDGIGCLTCHWRPEGLAGPHQGVQAPHPVVFDPGLRQVGTCTSCHQAKARLEDALLCHFNTGEEWAEASPGQTCQGCHMPAVHRSVAPGAPARDGGRHTWFGGGVAKGPVDPAVRELWDAWQPGYELSLRAPEDAAAGQMVEVVASIAHARAGHLVPTGDPERHLLVLLEVRAGGQVLQRVEHRIGQRWQWQPVAKKLGDNRLKPGDSRDYVLRFEMPAAPVQVDVQVRHVRLTEENFRYHLDLFQRDGQTALAGALQALPLSAVRAKTGRTIQLR
jgi:hypothetical protein